LLHMFFKQVSGFKGHSVKQAQEIRNRRSFEGRHTSNAIDLYEVSSLTGAEVEGLLDRWIAAVYDHRPHAGLHGSTPHAEYAAREANGEVRRVADERQIDMLFGEDGVATVTSKGLRIQRAHGSPRARKAGKSRAPTR
jgi:putative transposase